MAKIIISKENFYYNLNQIALKTGSKEKIAIVLKDNAYGHGLVEMAQLASAFGIVHAVVRNSREAEIIKKYFPHILVLGDRALTDEVCSFVLNDLSDIERAETGAQVELKVDTGMHRNGIAPEMLDQALKKIKERGLRLVGVMTHFRAADEMGSSLFWQQKRFEYIKVRVIEAGFENVRFHSHNSAAILRSNSFSEDLVRVGIAAYGYSELPKTFGTVSLKPVMKLTAKRVSTRDLNQGERIGYGGDFIASKPMRVSSYDIGYGDGWCRGNAFAPYVTAEGLPFLGRVSMDFVSVEGDKEEICIFDDAQKAAAQLGTISYEVMTALSEEIERRVI
jgi:alanine racemase